jgi:hypothetical protein
MRKCVAVIAVALVALSFAVFQGCDWEDTGSESFNTSQGAGATINFSGYYRPRSGAFLMGSNLTHFVMTQVGNSLEVFDSNNSHYTGSIGSPGVQARPTVAAGFLPGAVMLQAQLSFAGVNQFTGADMTFVGIVRVVAVDDVQGVDRSTTVDTSDSFGLDISDTSTPGTTVTIGNSSNQTDTVTTTTTFTITEANTQNVIDGNWIEGGAVSVIGAIAPSTASTFSTATTTTTTAGP